MKLSIKRRANIYGMAMDRKRAIKVMCSLNDVINDHIIECVVYHEERSSTLAHWVEEIAAYLNQIDGIKCCSQLKKRDYMESVFSPFGDARGDAKWNLSYYKFRNARKSKENQYPDFEITEELIDKLYATYQAVITNGLPWLMSKTEHSMEEWENLLSPILT